MLSKRDFEILCQRNDLKLIEATARGPKIFEAAHGEMIKIFRAKRGFSSNNYKPYALRFCQNSNKLNALGIVAPRINLVQYCSELKLHVVHYHKIPGENALSLVRNGDPTILNQALAFVSRLHKEGVFFRAIHLSNFLLQKDGQFALIDVADTKFKNSSLSFLMRYRNLKHLFSCQTDRAFWAEKGVAHWIDVYGSFCQLPAYQVKLLHYLLK